MLGCLLPVLPYVIVTGAVALCAAAVIAVLVGAAIAFLRPERGVLAVAETFGVLAAAGLLCWGASLI